VLPSQRLAELNSTLPPVPKPVASYTPAVRAGRLAYTSGQLSMREGKLLHAGKVPSDVTIQAAADAAGIAALNAVAAIAQVAGGIDNIERIVRVCVYVNSAAGFTEQPKVANGASDLLIKIFGDAGRHARSAVGASELPLNAAVEVELIAEIADT
jgi:enamine deaminase RidA (YjgF/YER057c/UK114 family)